MALTNTFLNSVIASIQNNINTNWTYGAVGTGTTPATASDTALESEILRKARFSIDISNPDSAIVTLFIDATEGNGQTISELGWFDASSGGNLQQRITGFSINKTSDIELTLESNVSIVVQSV